MKYTLITMFSMNMILKAIISSSASLMWSLVHVLQVFRYILMINIEMPKVMDILMKYLAVVVGEIDEIEDLVPNFLSQYALDMDALSINITLYQRFEDNGKPSLDKFLGYESPFIGILFSRQMTIILIGFLFTLPFIGIGVYFFKPGNWFHSKMSDMWDSFWWNAPVRTFTELYIEISLAFFINTLNVRSIILII